MKIFKRLLISIISATLLIALDIGTVTGIIIIDAGHGSPDGGSVGVTGIPEKDYNLSLSLILRSILAFSGLDCGMTRSGDEAIYTDEAQTIREKKVSDLHERIRIANEATEPLFVSIHMNASPVKSANGIVVYYAPSEGSAELAEAINAVFIKSVDAQKVRETKAAPKEVYLTKNLNCPAVIIECGFISNGREEKLLGDKDYRAKLAFLIACGLISHCR